MTTLVSVCTFPFDKVVVTRCVLVLGVKLTCSAELVTVTRPPPIVLNTTSPGLVATGVADAGVLGATRTVVAAGTVLAAMSEDRALEMDEAEDAEADTALTVVDDAAVVELTWVVVVVGGSVVVVVAVVGSGVVVAVVTTAVDVSVLLAAAAGVEVSAAATVVAAAPVVVVLSCRLARRASFDARAGLSAWTCLRAERCSGNTPSLNLGASKWRTACKVASSTLSRRASH